MEEAVFATRSIIAVDHPQGLRLPNEGLTVPPLLSNFTRRVVRVPAHAVDNHGHDVLERIKHLDRHIP